tara:strand:+ start:1397 stop:1579 length:183 start_codon:yes stop_codon:yes gene_type:complete
MNKKTLRLGIANSGEINIEVKEILTWKMDKISYIGDVMFFEHEGTFYSMKRIDYKNYIKK